MDTGVMIPLAVFAMVILIVGITVMAKVRDKETEVQQSLHLEEIEHRRKMEELEKELECVRKNEV